MYYPHIGDEITTGINITGTMGHHPYEATGTVTAIDPKGKWYMVTFDLGPWRNQWNGHRIIRECYYI